MDIVDALDHLDRLADRSAMHRASTESGLTLADATAEAHADLRVAVIAIVRALGCPEDRCRALVHFSTPPR